MNQEEYIRKNYKKESSKLIAQKLNITCQKVQSIARKIGVAEFSNKIKIIINDILIDYYNNKQTIKQICYKFKIGKSTVLEILRKHGCGGRKPHETGIIYNCDINFFESIDTPEKAYWFGFIAADGNICNGKLQIRLHEKDKDHIKKFCDRIEYNGPIFQEKLKSTVGVIISRKKIINDLKKYGLTENKTLNIDQHIFDKIPKKFLWPAIHGYIDGDGGFSKNKKNKFPNFHLVGNQSFLKFIVDKFSEHGIFIKEPKKDKRTKQTYYISIYLSQDKVDKFINLFYRTGSKDFLKRKKQNLYVKV
jgi:hypothetical protein